MTRSSWIFRGLIVHQCRFRSSPLGDGRERIEDSTISVSTKPIATQAISCWGNDVETRSFPTIRRRSSFSKEDALADSAPPVLNFDLSGLFSGDNVQMQSLFEQQDVDLMWAMICCGRSTHVSLSLNSDYLSAPRCQCGKVPDGPGQVADLQVFPHY